VNEELLYPDAVQPKDVILRRVALESAILNPAFVAHVTVRASSREIIEFAGQAADRAEFEPRTVQCIPLELQLLASLLKDPARKWHPTARYRIMVLMEARFGEAKAAAALNL